MFLFRQKTYEVQACRDGRWTIEQTAHDPKDAEAAAKALLNKLKGVEAVRVVLDGAREKVLFEQKKAAGQAPIVIPQIEEAPACETPDDLYGPASRKVINRLFRQYLDRVVLTPTEIMHNGREMKRIMDQGSIVQTAIDRVARVQKDLADADPHRRRETLWRLVESVSRRARDADKLKLPSVRQVGFDEVLKFIIKNAKPDELKFLVRCTLSRELSASRSWYAKLSQVLEWTSLSREDAALVLLDDFVSDTLSSGSLIQDVLGQQPSLADALLKLLDIADGRADAPSAPGATQPPEMQDLERALCGLMATGRLVATREILLERVRSELRGSNPLSRSRPEAEEERFLEIIDRVLLDRGVAAGPGMAEALVQRATRILNTGGPSGLREGIRWVAARAPFPLAAAHFLVAAAESRIGETVDDEPAIQLEELIGGAASLAGLVSSEGGPIDRMRAVTALYNRVRASGALPEETAAAVAGRLDDLLLDYVVRGKIVEQMDNPEWKLRTRAFQLMHMCTPEVLPDGKAVRIARKAVVAHLRRPNFEVELVADLKDPEQRERTLTQFHQLLAAGGFR